MKDGFLQEFFETPGIEGDAMMCSFTVGGYCKQSKTGYIFGYLEPYFADQPLTRIVRRVANLNTDRSFSAGPPASINFRTVKVNGPTEEWYLEVDMAAAVYRRLSDREEGKDYRE